MMQNTEEQELDAIHATLQALKMPSVAQLGAAYRAACVLADRYRRERDGARAETAATKSKLTDIALEPVAEAIAKALAATRPQNLAGRSRQKPAHPHYLSRRK